jgi:hypothetical protein
MIADTSKTLDVLPALLCLLKILFNRFFYCTIHIELLFLPTTGSKIEAFTMSPAETKARQNKAIVYAKPGTSETAIEYQEIPEPGPGQILVRM